MDRRGFVKLAAASPALASPVYAGCSDGNPDGDASGTVIGAPSTRLPDRFHLLFPSRRGMVPRRGVLRVDLDDSQQRGPSSECLLPDLWEPVEPGLPPAPRRLGQSELRLPGDHLPPGRRLLHRRSRLPRLRLLRQASGRVLVHGGGRREAPRPLRPGGRGALAVPRPDPQSRERRRPSLPGELPGRRGEPVRDHLPLHLQYQHVPAPGQQQSRPVRPPGP